MALRRTKYRRNESTTRNQKSAKCHIGTDVKACTVYKNEAGRFWVAILPLVLDICRGYGYFLRLDTYHSRRHVSSSVHEPWFKRSAVTGFHGYNGEGSRSEKDRGGRGECHFGSKRVRRHEGCGDESECGATSELGNRQFADGPPVAEFLCPLAPHTLVVFEHSSSTLSTRVVR